MRRVNWALWSAPLLAIFALYSYPLVFVRWPVTRDVPWVNLGLVAVTLAALAVGVRRAFDPSRGWASRLSVLAVAPITLAAAGFFVYGVFVTARHLPVSSEAPNIGERLPAFTLLNQDGAPVSLASLLTASPGSRTLPRGVLLIFYRGYW
jgi:hypothetical protein